MGGRSNKKCGTSSNAATHEAAPGDQAQTQGIAVGLVEKDSHAEGAPDTGVPGFIRNLPTPSRNRGGQRQRNGQGTPSNSGGERQGNARNHGAQASVLEDVMRRKGIDEAWNTLEEMQRQGVLTDKYTVSRMLMKTVGDARSRTNAPRVYRALSVVERFINTQPTEVDEVLFNAVLDTCGSLKDMRRLESTVTRMRELKVTPSPVTLGILVKTFGQAGDLAKVIQVWDEMKQQRELANSVTYGCMIDACVKCGNLDKAIEVFQGMKDEGKHRNTILYTTLIKGYGAEKNLEKAMKLFHEMRAENVPYNTITYNSIIDVCVKCGDIPQGESLLREIVSPGNPLEPDLITFSTLLKGYCHVGDLDKALQTVECIKGRGLQCDVLVYNTLMNGCVKAGDITVGVGLFEEMVQSGMRPTSITHSILLRLFQKGGCEDDAMEAIAQLYIQHGIEKPSAYSGRSSMSAKEMRASLPDCMDNSPYHGCGSQNQSLASSPAGHMYPSPNQNTFGMQHLDNGMQSWGMSPWGMSPSQMQMMTQDGTPMVSPFGNTQALSIDSLLGLNSPYAQPQMNLMNSPSSFSAHGTSMTPMGAVPLNLPMEAFTAGTMPNPMLGTNPTTPFAAYSPVGTMPGLMMPNQMMVPFSTTPTSVGTCPMPSFALMMSADPCAPPTHGFGPALPPASQTMTMTTGPPMTITSVPAAQMPLALPLPIP